MRFVPDQTILCRSAALAIFACSAFAAVQAQQMAVPGAAIQGPTVSPSLLASVTDGPLDGLTIAAPSLDNTGGAPGGTLDLAHSAGVTYSSSNSPELDAVDASAAGSLGLPGADATQPPPRRRYGRPRYNDSSHNPDGSSKYAFIAGVGLTLPTGNTYHYLNTSYSFQVGAGRNFNKNFGVLVQFDWDAFGFNGRTLGNQDPVEGAGGQLDGNNHIWSVTLNPVYNIYAREGLGAYVVGGVGFYHKVANFTVPVVEEGYDYLGYLEQYEANEIIDHYTSNAVGFNGGFGLTFKPSRFSSQRLYAEARYVFIDNQQRPGYNPSNPNYNSNYNGYDFYRPNSNRTTYIPIKFGIRF